LLDASDTLAEARVALRVAERAGLPTDQQRFNAAKLEAAVQHFASAPQFQLGFDCGSWVRIADGVAQMAQRGELALAMDLLSRSTQRAASGPLH
jgi:hypothetical protein